MTEESRLRITWDEEGTPVRFLDWTDEVSELPGLPWSQSVLRPRFTGASFAGVIPLGGVERELPFSRLVTYPTHAAATLGLLRHDAGLPARVKKTLTIRVLDHAVLAADPDAPEYALTAAAFTTPAALLSCEPPIRVQGLGGAPAVDYRYRFAIGELTEVGLLPPEATHLWDGDDYDAGTGTLTETLGDEPMTQATAGFRPAAGFTFDGSDDRVQTAGALIPADGDFSLGIRYTPTGSGSNRHVLGQYTGSNAGRFLLAVGADNRPYVFQGTAGLIVTAAGAVSAGAPATIILTRNGNDWSLYHDDAAAVTATVAATVEQSAFRAGGTAAGQSAAGTIHGIYLDNVTGADSSAVLNIKRWLES